MNKTTPTMKCLLFFVRLDVCDFNRKSWGSWTWQNIPNTEPRLKPQLLTACLQAINPTAVIYNWPENRKKWEKMTAGQRPFTGQQRHAHALQIRGWWWCLTVSTNSWQKGRQPHYNSAHLNSNLTQIKSDKNGFPLLKSRVWKSVTHAGLPRSMWRYGDGVSASIWLVGSDYKLDLIPAARFPILLM